MPPTEPELRVLHQWLDCWRGVGDVVTGMKRQGDEVSLGDHGGQWLAVFYAGRGGYEALNAAGTAQAATPWRAVQRAAWEALRLFGSANAAQVFDTRREGLYVGRGQ